MSKEKIYKFTDPAKPAASLILLIKFEIVLALISVISSINELRVLTGIKNRNFASEEAMNSAANCSDIIEAVIGCIQLLLAGVVLIVFLRWMYRAAANNHAWRIENITQKPHWGWINYIIPFWSLVKPYEFFREIWNAVEFDKSEPAAWKKLPAPKCLKIYWTCFLISNILGRAVFRMTLKAESIDAMITVNSLNMLNEFVDIVLNMALIALIAGIMQRQKAFAAKAEDASQAVALPTAD